MLLGIAVLLTQMIYGVLRYPSDLSQSHLPSFLASVASLLAYAGAAHWARSQTSDSAKIALSQGTAIALLFMPHMQQVLASAYAQSAAIAPKAFVIQNTLSSGLMHVLLAPLVAAVFGFAGGCVCALLRSIRRSVAIVLCLLNILFVGTGLAAIRFASALNRPDRPPFVMGGLLVLGWQWLAPILFLRRSAIGKCQPLTPRQPHRKHTV